ncbi:MAG: penicillin-binding protein 2 [Coriobacteriales bacterium]|jgi:cell division protein FtsI (penicillin-binding protein 3)|nr:penicillin-binding protein 2 [Coriobacteriales bacterium]
MSKNNKNATPGKNSKVSTATVDVFNRLLGSREGLVVALFVIIVLIIFVKLLMLTIVDAQALAAEGQEKRTLEYTLEARRGTIFDRNGSVLAASVEATTIYADPSKIVDPPKTAQVLSEVLGGTAQQYFEALTNDRESTFVYIAKKASPETAQKLKDSAQQYRDAEVQAIKARGNDVPVEIVTPLTGIGYLPDTKREYPYGHIGAQIIGAVNDENAGISGLEQTYDSILRGVDGKMVIQKGKAMDQSQNPLPIIGGIQEQVLAIDGQDIIISVDIELQQYLEYNLKAVADQRNCQNANALLLDGATGEIIAGASLPLYDREKVSVEDVAAGATTLKAITSPYEPGSTFKVCIAATALENSIMTPEDSLYCPAELDIYDYTIKDAVKRSDEEMTLSQIIARSSNVGASLMQQKVGDELFNNYLQRFGMGAFTHVDYPGETNGMLAALEDWNPVQAANISFGQGLQVSSLQMAGLYGAIANDGLLIQPHFLIARPQYDSELVFDSRQVLEPVTARVVEDILRGVVTDGTGKAADLPGLDVVGKTGTAEIASPQGGYLASEFITSFVGYIDNSNSKLVFISSFDRPANYNNAPSTPFFSIIMSFVANRYMITPVVEPDPQSHWADESGLANTSESGSGTDENAGQTDPTSGDPALAGSADAPQATVKEDSWRIDTGG